MMRVVPKAVLLLQNKVEFVLLVFACVSSSLPHL